MIKDTNNDSYSNNKQKPHFIIRKRKPTFREKKKKVLNNNTENSLNPETRRLKTLGTKNRFQSLCDTKNKKVKRKIGNRISKIGKFSKFSKLKSKSKEINYNSLKTSTYRALKHMFPNFLLEFNSFLNNEIADTNVNSVSKENKLFISENSLKELVEFSNLEKTLNINKDSRNNDSNNNIYMDWMSSHSNKIDMNKNSNVKSDNNGNINFTYILNVFNKIIKKSSLVDLEENDNNNYNYDIYNNDDNNDKDSDNSNASEEINLIEDEINNTNENNSLNNNEEMNSNSNNDNNSDNNNLLLYDKQSNKTFKESIQESSHSQRNNNLEIDHDDIILDTQELKEDEEAVIKKELKAQYFGNLLSKQEKSEIFKKFSPRTKNNIRRLQFSLKNNYRNNLMNQNKDKISNCSMNSLNTINSIRTISGSNYTNRKVFINKLIKKTISENKKDSTNDKQNNKFLNLMEDNDKNTCSDLEEDEDSDICKDNNGNDSNNSYDSDDSNDSNDSVIEYCNRMDKIATKKMSSMEKLDRYIQRSKMERERMFNNFVTSQEVLEDIKKLEEINRKYMEELEKKKTEKMNIEDTNNNNESNTHSNNRKLLNNFDNINAEINDEDNSKNQIKNNCINSNNEKYDNDKQNNDDNNNIENRVLLYSYSFPNEQANLINHNIIVPNSNSFIINNELPDIKNFNNLNTLKELYTPIFKFNPTFTTLNIIQGSKLQFKLDNKNINNRKNLIFCYNKNYKDPANPTTPTLLNSYYTVKNETNCNEEYYSLIKKVSFIIDNHELDVEKKKDSLIIIGLLRISLNEDFSSSINLIRDVIKKDHFITDEASDVSVGLNEICLFDIPVDYYNSYGHQNENENNSSNEEYSNNLVFNICDYENLVNNDNSIPRIYNQEMEDNKLLELSKNKDNNNTFKKKTELNILTYNNIPNYFNYSTTNYQGNDITLANTTTKNKKNNNRNKLSINQQANYSNINYSNELSSLLVSEPIFSNQNLYYKLYKAIDNLKDTESTPLSVSLRTILNRRSTTKENPSYSTNYYHQLNQELRNNFEKKCFVKYKKIMMMKNKYYDLLLKTLAHSFFSFPYMKNLTFLTSTVSNNNTNTDINTGVCVKEDILEKIFWYFDTVEYLNRKCNTEINDNDDNNLVDDDFKTNFESKIQADSDIGEFFVNMENKESWLTANKEKCLCEDINKNNNNENDNNTYNETNDMIFKEINGGDIVKTCEACNDSLKYINNKNEFVFNGVDYEKIFKKIENKGLPGIDFISAISNNYTNLSNSSNHTNINIYLSLLSSITTKIHEQLKNKANTLKEKYAKIVKSNKQSKEILEYQETTTSLFPNNNERIRNSIDYLIANSLLPNTSQLTKIKTKDSLILSNNIIGSIILNTEFQTKGCLVTDIKKKNFYILDLSKNILFGLVVNKIINKEFDLRAYLEEIHSYYSFVKNEMDNIKREFKLIRELKIRIFNAITNRDERDEMANRDNKDNSELIAFKKNNALVSNRIDDFHINNVNRNSKTKTNIKNSNYDDDMTSEAVNFKIELTDLTNDNKDNSNITVSKNYYYLDKNANVYYNNEYKSIYDINHNINSNDLLINQIYNKRGIRENDDNVITSVKQEMKNSIYDNSNDLFNIANGDVIYNKEDYEDYNDINDIDNYKSRKLDINANMISTSLDCKPFSGNNISNNILNNGITEDNRKPKARRKYVKREKKDKTEKTEKKERVIKEKKAKKKKILFLSLKRKQPVINTNTSNSILTSEKKDKLFNCIREKRMSSIITNNNNNTHDVNDKEINSENMNSIKNDINNILLNQNTEINNNNNLNTKDNTKRKANTRERTIRKKKNKSFKLKFITRKVIKRPGYINTVNKDIKDTDNKDIKNQYKHNDNEDDFLSSVMNKSLTDYYNNEDKEINNTNKTNNSNFNSAIKTKHSKLFTTITIKKRSLNMKEAYYKESNKESKINKAMKKNKSKINKSSGNSNIKKNNKIGYNYDIHGVVISKESNLIISKYDSNCYVDDFKISKSKTKSKRKPNNALYANNFTNVNKNSIQSKKAEEAYMNSDLTKDLIHLSDISKSNVNYNINNNNTNNITIYNNTNKAIRSRESNTYNVENDYRKKRNNKKNNKTPQSKVLTAYPKIETNNFYININPSTMEVSNSLVKQTQNNNRKKVTQRNRKKLNMKNKKKQNVQISSNNFNTKAKITNSKITSLIPIKNPTANITTTKNYTNNYNNDYNKYSNNNFSMSNNCSSSITNNKLPASSSLNVSKNTANDFSFNYKRHLPTLKTNIYDDYNKQQAVSFTNNTTLSKNNSISNSDYYSSSCNLASSYYSSFKKNANLTNTLNAFKNNNNTAYTHNTNNNTNFQNTSNINNSNCNKSATVYNYNNNNSNILGFNQQPVNYSSCKSKSKTNYVFNGKPINQKKVKKIADEQQIELLTTAGYLTRNKTRAFPETINEGRNYFEEKIYDLSFEKGKKKQ